MGPLREWPADPLSVRHHVLVLALSDRVMFPGIRSVIEVPYTTFLKARRFLKEGRAGGIGLVARCPSIGELYEMGTFCWVVSHIVIGGTGGEGRTTEASHPSIRLVVEGRSRCRVLHYTQLSPLPVTTVQLLEEPLGEGGVTVSSLALHVQKHILELLGPTSQRQPQWPQSASGLADVVGAALAPLSIGQRQQILETVDVQERLELVLPLVQEAVWRQRESVGMNPSMTWPILGAQPGVQSARDSEGAAQELEEVEQLSRRVSKAGLTGDALRIARRELGHLKAMQPQHPEYSVAFQYVETLASLPWNTCTEDRVDLATASACLDADHCGLQRVKRRILEFLAVQKLRRGVAAGPILCLHGPPGIGKTSLVRSVARAVGRKFHNIALGGVRDEAELRGHRRTYIGSSPGVLIHALMQLGVKNPVILLDEVDKLAQGATFNPEAALLEILDPEQNTAFKDHYLGTPFDLSRVIFICTANDISLISRPLLDRLEVLELSGYTIEEKVSIVKTHLLPKQRRLHALQHELCPREASADPSVVPLEAIVPLEEDSVTEEASAVSTQERDPTGVMLTLTAEAIAALITRWTAESGVRSLERHLAHICRWAALRLQGIQLSPTGNAGLNRTPEAGMTSCGPNADGCITVDAGHLPHIIGPQRFEPALAQPLTTGTAMGVTLSTLGARLFFVEAARMQGSSRRLTVTGAHGQVMVESVEVAMSLLRCRFSHKRDLAPGFLANEDIHVHFPSDALSTDGPSAGLAVLLSLASLVTHRPLRSDTAAVGEITLRGQLLPVNGVRDKVLAAHRAGIQHLLLPLANRQQVVDDIPPDVFVKIKVHYLKCIEEALAWFFVSAPCDGAPSKPLHTRKCVPALVISASKL